MSLTNSRFETGDLPEGEELKRFVERRHATGRLWRAVFLASTMVGIIALSALLLNIMDGAFGLVAVRNRVEPEALAVEGVPLQQLSAEQLVTVLQKHLSAAVVRRLDSEQPLAGRSQAELYALVLDRVVSPEVLEAWTLSQSLFGRGEVEQILARDFPDARLVFRSWLNLDLLRNTQSSVPERAGVRTAVLGSLWIILITVAVAFPTGVGAAIYLEEYARDNWVNRVIQTNISNLGGVPSIIYGLLGLAVFVRGLEPLTSGTLLGLSDPTTANGRTILSAGLTLALLILPLIITNAQEAIRAVPRSLRYAGYSLGATQWQTIAAHVLPNALAGILTGTILAMSRAIGETAPLVVVGATTFIAVDPSGPFSKFTALPMQIYQWTARPQDEFRRIAAAAILVLLVLLLALNASAIWLRNRYSRRGY
jgi:phosphate transport system permease protein